MVNGVPQQGDIIKLDLDPRKGHEQQGFRPVIEPANAEEIAMIDERMKDYENDPSSFAPLRH